MTTYFDTVEPTEIVHIHDAALSVLEQGGVKVESQELLAILSEYGGKVDAGEEIVRFSRAWVEDFIAESDKYDWSRHRPRIGCFAGIYQSLYLNPETDKLESFTPVTLERYIRLANSLEGLGSIGLLGLPFVPEEAPAAYGPLTEKLYAWRYGAHPSGTVQLTGLCPYIIEIYARYAEEDGRPLEEIFGATGYLISPLRLPRSECQQLMYFRSRGLRMGIGHMLSLGGSTPITIAGAAVVKLAEDLFLSILRRALWGGRSLGVGGFGVALDLMSARSMGGRPEIGAVTAVLAQVARFYGVRSHGTGALTDAKEPSVQAGAQKALLAVSGALSCGSAAIDCGLLALDEILSPEQMIYDVEIASAVNHLLRPVEVSEEACAVAEILAAGPGGNFMGAESTAKRFRTEQWQPKLWDRDSLHGWMQAGSVRERARVRVKIKSILDEVPPAKGLSEGCERDILTIINRAVEKKAINKEL